jgi:hypothetical protein
MQAPHTTRPRSWSLVPTILATASVCLALGCETLDEPELGFDGPDTYLPPTDDEPEAPDQQIELIEDNGMIIATGDDFRVRIHRSRRVAELNVSRDQLAQWYAESFPRWSHQATRRLYEVFADDFDFIVFVPASEGQHPAIVDDGQSIRVRNDVSGLGLAIHDHSAFWGSSGRLQSTIMLGGVEHIVSGPSLRELGERWGNAFVPTTDVDHWGFSDVGGQLGGCTPDEIEPLGHDTYQCDFDGTNDWSPDGAIRNDRPYAQLELYLMGLIGAEAVPDIQFADDGEWINPDLGVFSGTLQTATMDELRDQHGKREPALDTSQREFRTLFVMVSGGDLVELPLFHRLDLRVTEFTAPEPWLGESGMLNFYQATSGLAALDAEDLDAALH